jgi:hypothetical protein
MENMNNWLDQEVAEINAGGVDKVPTLKFEENKIVEFEVDFTNPFQKWTGTQGRGDITKAIIPCTENGVKKNLWLNVKNPLYGELVTKGKEGQKMFKVIQIGNQAKTVYKMVV